MIYEMRTYTLKAGTAAEVAKNAGEIGRAIRGDDYGKLEGYWISEIGSLNQVWHLWSYADMNERMRLRAELGRNRRWVEDYVPLIRAKLVRQDIRLMTAAIPPKAPEKPGNIYEFRYYRLLPGAAPRWHQLLKDVLPAREKISKIVGAWTTEAGQPNEISHMWAYPSLNARMEARAKAMQDPAWQNFLKEDLPLIDEMSNVILLPAGHSPLK
jgi:hypothetical protein